MTYQVVSSGWTTTLSFTHDNTWQELSMPGSEGDVYVLYIENTFAGGRAIGARPNKAAGSHTDARSDDINNQCDTMCYVVAGDSGDIEILAEDTNVNVYHTGTIPAADIELVQDKDTAATDLALASTGWVTDTLSPTGTPVAAIIEMVSSTTASDFGVRHPDRTEDRRGNGGKHNWAICPMKGDDIEVYVASTSAQNHYLLAFILSGYTQYETTGQDARDDSQSSGFGSYADLTALPVGAIAGQWHVDEPDGTNNDSFIRQKGLTHDYYSRSNSAWKELVVEGNGSRLVEAKTVDGNTDLYLKGSFDAAAGGPSLPAGSLALLGVGI